MAKSELATCLIPSATRPLSSDENPLSAGSGLREVRQKRKRSGTSFLYIDYIKNVNISTEMLLKEKIPSQVVSRSR